MRKEARRRVEEEEVAGEGKIIDFVPNEEGVFQVPVESHSQSAGSATQTFQEAVTDRNEAVDVDGRDQKDEHRDDRDDRSDDDSDINNVEPDKQSAGNEAALSPEATEVLPEKNDIQRVHKLPQRSGKLVLYYLGNNIEGERRELWDKMRAARTESTSSAESSADFREAARMEEWGNDNQEKARDPIHSTDSSNDDDHPGWAAFLKYRQELREAKVSSVIIIKVYPDTDVDNVMQLLKKLGINTRVKNGEIKFPQNAIDSEEKFVQLVRGLAELGREAQIKNVLSDETRPLISCGEEMHEEEPQTEEQDDYQEKRRKSLERLADIIDQAVGTKYKGRVVNGSQRRREVSFRYRFELPYGVSDLQLEKLGSQLQRDLHKKCRIFRPKKSDSELVINIPLETDPMPLLKALRDYPPSGLTAALGETTDMSLLGLDLTADEIGGRILISDAPDLHRRQLQQVMLLSLAWDNSPDELGLLLVGQGLRQLQGLPHADFVTAGGIEKIIDDMKDQSWRNKLGLKSQVIVIEDLAIVNQDLCNQFLELAFTPHIHLIAAVNENDDRLLKQFSFLLTGGPIASAPEPPKGGFYAFNQYMRVNGRRQAEPIDFRPYGISDRDVRTLIAEIQRKSSSEVDTDTSRPGDAVEPSSPYEQFLRRVERTKEIPGIPDIVTISVSLYPDAQEAIKRIKQIGVEASITQGGIMVHHSTIDSEQKYARLQQVLQDLDLEMQHGDTFSVGFRKAMRNEK